MEPAKVTVLAELTVQPQHLGEAKALVAATAHLNRTEPGCEAFFVTTKHDDPNTLVLFEVFASAAAHEAHLATDCPALFCHRARHAGQRSRAD